MSVLTGRLKCTLKPVGVTRNITHALRAQITQEFMEIMFVSTNVYLIILLLLMVNVKNVETDLTQIIHNEFVKHRLPMIPSHVMIENKQYMTELVATIVLHAHPIQDSKNETNADLMIVHNTR